MTASPLTCLGFGTEALSPSPAADSRLHPAGNDFPAASELTHTHRHIPVHTQALTGLTFRGSPPPFPRSSGIPAPGCHPAPDKAQGRLPEEGSQLLPAPGWVEADVSNPCSSEGPKTDDITPSSCPSSPPESLSAPRRGCAWSGEEEEGRQGGGGRGKGGKAKAGAGSWLLWQKDKVLQNFTGQTSKRWKNWRLSSGRSCYQGEPYLSMGLMAHVSRSGC